MDRSTKFRTTVIWLEDIGVPTNLLQRILPEG
jgi:hypothetical protein